MFTYEIHNTNYFKTRYFEFTLITSVYNNILPSVHAIWFSSILLFFKHRLDQTVGGMHVIDLDMFARTRIEIMSTESSLKSGRKNVAV